MKRKIISLFLILCCFATVTTFSACKDNEDSSLENSSSISSSSSSSSISSNDSSSSSSSVIEEGLSYALSADESYYTVTGVGTLTDTALVIPATYNNLPVKAIQEYAFKDCNQLTSIEIPESITSIGMYAFYNCSELTGVYITDIKAWCSIDFIGYYANPLYMAKNLYLNNLLVTDLVLPVTVTEIKSSTFSGCSSLTNIRVPVDVTAIGFYAFENCNNLTSLEVLSGVTSIADYAFLGCNSLTSIYYGDSSDKWEEISISPYAGLTNATVYFYSATEQSGCWRYIGTVPTPW